MRFLRDKLRRHVKTSQRRRLSCEQLEARKVLTATLYLDFGDAFANSMISMQEDQIKSMAIYGPDLTPTTAGSSIYYNARNFNSFVNFDYNQDGSTSSNDDALMRADIVQAVRDVFQPFQIDVVELTAANQVVNGITVSGADNTAEIGTTLAANNASAPEHNDAYIVISAISLNAPLSPSMLTTDAGRANDQDINSMSNLRDDTAFVLLNNIIPFVAQSNMSRLGTIIGNVAAHEAGHLFGLQHTNNGGKGSMGPYSPAQVDQQMLVSNDVMVQGYPGALDDFAGRRFITRYNVQTAAGNYYNQFNQLANDINVGLRTTPYSYGSPARVATGTGAHDRITIAGNGTQITVTVQPFRDAALTIPIGPAIPANITLTAGTALWIYGGDGDDQITTTGTGSSASGLIFGDAGNDRLDAQVSGNLRFSLYGGAGDDYMRGINSNVEGGPGNDVYDGGSWYFTFQSKYQFPVENLGSDLILGSTAGAVLNFQNFAAPVNLNLNNTSNLVVSTGLLTLQNLVPNNFSTIIGSNFGNTIFASNQSTYIVGGNGSDYIVGGLGNDTIYGIGGNDTIYAGGGNDTIYGGSGNSSLYGQDGDDKIYGEGGNDYLVGGLGNDLLAGGVGSDQIYGGDGNDTLYDGDVGVTDFASIDYLYGELGIDSLFGDSRDTLLV